MGFQEVNQMKQGDTSQLLSMFERVDSQGVGRGCL
jgi:hypothetical protein